MPATVIPEDTELYRALSDAARRRCLIFAGLPGTGKSLLTQQCAAIASAAGREVTLLQWDIARQAFATDAIKVRYPEIAGVTHPNIRWAVDRWARVGVARWNAAAGPGSLLIIEAPLIGGRLSSLTTKVDDDSEALLSSADSLFLLPVPSRDVKAALRDKRGDTGHRQLDAQVSVLDAHVAEIAIAGAALGLTKSEPVDYDPNLYAAVYLHAMRHRHTRLLAIDRLYDVSSSVYDRAAGVVELAPLATEIDAAFSHAEGIAVPTRDHAQAEWYR